MVRWFEEAGYETDLAGLREDYPWLLTLEEYLRQTGWQGAPELFKNRPTKTAAWVSFAQKCAVLDFAFSHIAVECKKKSNS